MVNNTATKRNIVIPVDNWRAPNQEELDKLIVRDEGPFSDEQVGLLKLDTATVKALKMIRFEECSTREELDSLLKSVLWLKAKSKMQSFADQFLTIKELPIETGLSFREGNLKSTTINTINKQYTGLHFDSWEYVGGMTERQRARNRICFNLGRYPRYFVFLNLSLAKVYEMMKRGFDFKEFSKIPAKDINFVLEFLAVNPSYPITKIKLNPYEAYIAPTESILHDGSSEGHLGIDITYTLRSYYRMKPIADLRKLV